MAATRTSARSTARKEMRVRRGIALVLGVAGLATGLLHVRDVAIAHEASPWEAWTAAVTVELVVLYASLELRRRHLAGTRKIWPPVTFGAVGFGLSMSAQVDQAQYTVWGWVLAAWPVLAFLGVAKFEIAALGQVDTIPRPQVDRTGGQRVSTPATVHLSTPPLSTPEPPPAEPEVSTPPPPEPAPVQQSLSVVGGRRVEVPPEMMARLLAGEMTHKEAAEELDTTTKSIQRRIRDVKKLQATG